MEKQSGPSRTKLKNWECAFASLVAKSSEGKPTTPEAFKAWLEKQYEVLQFAKVNGGFSKEDLALIKLTNLAALYMAQFIGAIGAGHNTAPLASLIRIATLTDDWKTEMWPTPP